MIFFQLPRIATHFGALFLFSFGSGVSLCESQGLSAEHENAFFAASCAQIAGEAEGIEDGILVSRTALTILAVRGESNNEK